MHDWIIPQEMLDQTDKITKLQARLEAAELALKMAGGFTDRLYRKDFFVAYDDWRKVKEGK